MKVEDTRKDIVLLVCRLFLSSITSYDKRADMNSYFYLQIKSKLKYEPSLAGKVVAQASNTLSKAKAYKNEVVSNFAFHLYKYFH